MKSTMKDHYITRIANIKKKKLTIPSVNEDVEPLELSYITSEESKMLQPLEKTVGQFL